MHYLLSNPIHNVYNESTSYNTESERYVNIDWLHKGMNTVYVPVQLIYGYVETGDDDDNDNEIDRNPILFFKDKGSFTYHIT